ncbi:VOC family protein [Streptomyces echinatus]|uniref:VOC family protein n=2 Tax=Streptomyces echinatus TaxID=67293 RepID=UPI0035592470
MRAEKRLMPAPGLMPSMTLVIRPATSDDDRVIELFDAVSTPPGGSAQPLDTDALPSDEERARSATLVHFAIRTEDPAALFQRAVAAGARALMEPAQVQAKGATGNMTLEVGFVYGLNGEVIEFIKRPTPKA